MLFTFKSIQKLNRKNGEIYLGTICLGEIKSWNFPTIESDVVNNDVVIVIYDVLINSSKDEIQVANPVFIYKLPNGDTYDEYPVLFVEHHGYFPKYCEQQLMACDFFNRLIETDDKISINSTKLITLRSLRDIIKDIDKYKIDQNQWPHFVKDLISYLKNLIDEYPVLGYLPVAERKRFRTVSIADSSLAWNFYFKFFVEEWIHFKRIKIPGISKTFTYNDWSGDFFDRANPLLHVYLGSSKKFYFNNAIRDSLYKIWKEWVKEA